MDEGSFRIMINMDARKLYSKDQQIISHSFELFGAYFILMIFPMVQGERRGQRTFKKSKGHGSVLLKHINGTPSAANLCFGISVGTEGKWQRMRGPVQHDFSTSAVCGLASEDEDWDFASAVEPGSSLLAVSVHVFP